MLWRAQRILRDVRTFHLIHPSKYFFPREVDGKNKVDMLTFHGCEKELAGAFGSNIEVRNAKFVLFYDH